MAWNKPSETKVEVKGGGGQRNVYLKGILVGAVAVVVGIVCIFAFSGKSEKPVKDTGTKPAKIKEVTPVKAQTNDVAKVKDEKPKRLTKLGTEIPDAVQPDEKGILRYPNGQRWADPKDVHIIQGPRPRVLFKHPSENQIASIIRLDPTKMAPFLVGVRPPFTEKFKEDFIASFNDTIVIDKDDSPEEAELRKAVLETKADLKEAMDRGEDIVKIMNDYQKELDRLCQYNTDIKKMVQDAMDDPEISDKDVEDYVTAANQMLEKQGITKMVMPNLTRRQARLTMLQERRKVLEAQKKQQEKTK